MTQNLQSFNYGILFTPSIVGLISYLFSKDLSGSLKNLRSRPPAIVFKYVWIILYLLIGAAWSFSIEYYKFKNNEVIDTMFLRSDDVITMIHVFYSLLIFSLFLWPIVYSRGHKKSALYILIFCILFTMVCAVLNPEISNLCISPLITWLIFALLLNFTAVG